MNEVHVVSSKARPLIALFALVVLNASVLNGSQGPAAAETGGSNPVPDDGLCTIDISLQTTPAFTERLACHYSNYPVFKSDRLIWNTPKTAAGRTVNLSTGKATADSATISLKDDRIPSTDSAGNMVLMPRAGHVYDLDSTSKITWSGVVNIFTTANDPAPVECQGGNYGGGLPSGQYVTGSTLKLKWDTVGNAGDVVHGTADALLSCAKIDLKGPRTPLGVIGKAVVRF
jgi:hypothetical protein